MRGIISSKKKNQKKISNRTSDRNHVLREPQSPKKKTELLGTTGLDDCPPGVVLRCAHCFVFGTMEENGGRRIRVARQWSTVVFSEGNITVATVIAGQVNL